MRKMFFPLLIASAAVFVLSSCSTSMKENDKLPDGRLISTHDNFLKRPDYRDTRDVWYNDARLEKARKGNTRILVNLDTQRGHLLVDGKEAMDFPVCTGKDSHETPRGKFTIIEKKSDYRSHSYGSVYNSSGDVVVSDATSGTRVPKGGKFVGARMPMWMRIHGGVGMHVGTVYRDAASHGCIRIPPEPCTIVFEKCPAGTPVQITE